MRPPATDARVCAPRTQAFIGVLDGHGQYGELCSDFVVQTLPPLLRQNLEHASMDMDTLQQILKSTFRTTNTLLHKHKIDSSLSGTTLTSVLMIGDRLITANVGDSRVVAAYRKTSRGGEVEYKAVPLTTDHKPELPQEKARIVSKGGRVAPWAQTDLDHILRVWLKDEDTPGIGEAGGVRSELGARRFYRSHPAPVLPCSSHVAILRGPSGIAGGYHCGAGLHGVQDYRESCLRPPGYGWNLGVHRRSRGRRHRRERHACSREDVSRSGRLFDCRR